MCSQCVPNQTLAPTHTNFKQKLRPRAAQPLKRKELGRVCCNHAVGGIGEA